MEQTPVMLLTGGTGSIGRVIAARALAEGWRVALHGRSSASIEGCMSQLGASRAGVAPADTSHADAPPTDLPQVHAAADAPANVAGFPADIRDAGATEQLVAQAASWAGRQQCSAAGQTECESDGAGRLTRRTRAADAGGHRPGGAVLVRRGRPADDWTDNQYQWGAERLIPAN